MPTIIHIVRHGEVHNPTSVFYGRLPNFGLSERGRQQAQGAARYLEDRPLAVIFASPQQRAQETAGFLAEHHPGLEILTDERLDEIYTPYDGEALNKMAAIGWNLYKDTAPEFEQPDDVVQRTQDFLAQIRRECSGNEIAAVTHGDVVAFALTVAFGETPVAGQRLHFTKFGLSESYPSTASVSTFTYQTDDPDERPQVKYKRPY
jgi:broad specificity phosphatase PhoE